MSCPQCCPHLHLSAETCALATASATETGPDDAEATTCCCHGCHGYSVSHPSRTAHCSLPVLELGLLSPWKAPRFPSTQRVFNSPGHRAGEGGFQSQPECKKGTIPSESQDGVQAPGQVTRAEVNVLLQFTCPSKSGSTALVMRGSWRHPHSCPWLASQLPETSSRLQRAHSTAHSTDKKLRLVTASGLQPCDRQHHPCRRSPCAGSLRPGPMSSTSFRWAPAAEGDTLAARQAAAKPHPSCHPRPLQAKLDSAGEGSSLASASLRRKRLQARGSLCFYSSQLQRTEGFDATWPWRVTQGWPRSSHDAHHRGWLLCYTQRS